LRQTPSPAINKEKAGNKEKNSPKFLDNDVLKTHLIDEEMTPVVEKNNFFSLLRENESLKEKLRHLEENQKTSEKQLLELKGKQKEYDLVLSKISVDSAEIKSPQFKTEQDILNTLFSRALAKKNFKKAINYLEDGADVNVVDAEGETPIFHSILHNQLAVTYFLKQHNANLEIKNKQGKTILHTVCELNDIEKVKCILDIFPKDNGVDGLLSVLEMKTISPEVSQLIANEVLFIAAKQNNVPLAAKALMKGADVNARDEKDEYEETALHKASYYKNLSMVKCLLRNKSDPTLKNKHGYTPLQVTNDVMIREQIARYTTTKTEIEIKSAAATVIQKHYRLFNTPKKLFREMSFLKEISFLRERSFPIIKGLMKQQRFDEVNELIELFSNPHVFRLRLKLDYYTAEMNLPFESFPKSAAEKKEDVSIVTKRFKL
ncbi:MAG: ankyrin repeat domain-containing protein, partial [Gammaproteobacteria bacterium]|nr:ankyrin repeat domain-containing protein [Gammaproteobacteria bacterium]